MRELKFRSWDKKRKCYAKHIMTTNTSCPYHDRMNMFKGVMTFAKWVLRRYVIEQYTGLKDKNGKEIYEGDIVHITPYFKKKGGKRFMAQKPYRNPLSVIEWDDDAGAFSENTYENGEFQIGGFLFEMALDSEILEGTQRHTIEVIGNIHENGDLLEG